MKEDRRKSRTRKAIRDAFMSLLSVKDVGEITITELSRKADINRKTFYNHYGSVIELVKEIEQDIVFEFEEAMGQCSLNMIILQPELFFETLNNVVSHNYDFYAALVNNDFSHGLLNKISQSLKDKMKIVLKESNQFDVGMIDMVVSYTVAGFLSIYQEVLKEGRVFDIETVTMFMRKIVMNGLEGLMIAKTH